MKVILVVVGFVINSQICLLFLILLCFFCYCFFLNKYFVFACFSFHLDHLAGRAPRFNIVFVWFFVSIKLPCMFLIVVWCIYIFFFSFFFKFMFQICVLLFVVLKRKRFSDSLLEHSRLKRKEKICTEREKQVATETERKAVAEAENREQRKEGQQPSVKKRAESGKENSF